ncbi:hypothetical protein VE25_03505 [Devosia geojensis]|uniref:DUF5615 domain-containing protein n=1 Tax=Devosia geojensis TaxID=443610 RepID=A0A0F5FWG0_9HYPH|nr:DUF5615 family PIN-like protein [Devosia geojensis]KKB13158.1 hypothetical protein VE25_03505 [Devosia geojensis]
MKILVNMNMSPRWATALTTAGIPATHWSEVGDAAEADDRIMAFAAANDWCVLTRDMDFSTILAATGNLSPSVILHRNGQRFSPALVDELVSILRQTRASLATGAVISVGKGRVRVRPLPID